VHSGADLVPLPEVVDGFAEIGQAKRSAWVRRQRLGDRLPPRFAEVEA
jgi:hypothetical protein